MNPPDPILIEDEEVWNPKYPVRKYEKQEGCKHIKFTLIVNGDKIFFQCNKCTITYSDSNGLDKVVEILLREQARRGRVKEYRL